MLICIEHFSSVLAYLSKVFRIFNKIILELIYGNGPVINSTNSGPPDKSGSILKLFSSGLKLEWYFLYP